MLKFDFDDYDPEEDGWTMFRRFCACMLAVFAFCAVCALLSSCKTSKSNYERDSCVITQDYQEALETNQRYVDSLINIIVSKEQEHRQHTEKDSSWVAAHASDTLIVRDSVRVVEHSDGRVDYYNYKYETRIVTRLDSVIKYMDSKTYMEQIKTLTDSIYQLKEKELEKDSIYSNAKTERFKEYVKVIEYTNILHWWQKFLCWSGAAMWIAIITYTAKRFK